MNIVFSDNYQFVLINNVLFKVSLTDNPSSCSKCMYKRKKGDSGPRCFMFLKDVGEDTENDKYRGFYFCYSNIFTRYLDDYVDINLIERFSLSASFKDRKSSLFILSYLRGNKCNINFNDRITI